MNANSKTQRKTSSNSKTVKKLVDEVRPQVTALEKKSKLTRPQLTTAYGALIEILHKTHNRPDSQFNKLQKVRGDRAFVFLEAMAGLIVDAVNSRRAA